MTLCTDTACAYAFLSIQWRVYQPQDGVYHSGRSQSQDARRLDAIANDESIHGARNTQSTWLKVQQRFVCSNAARDLIAMDWRLTACQWPVCTGNNTAKRTRAKGQSNKAGLAAVSQRLLVRTNGIRPITVYPVDHVPSRSDKLRL